jgi:biotin-dependent carboxylase-like uncharacterized protein
MSGRRLVVLDPGRQSLVQDRGRIGWLSAGVGAAGAADRGSFALANRLLANEPGAAAIECLLGGLSVRAESDCLITVTGASTPLHVDGTAHGMASVIAVPAGATISLGVATAGLRSYLAVRGGIDIAPVLGSRSRDTLSGIGPEPLRTGDVLPIGPEPAQWPIVDYAPVQPPTTGALRVRARLGPRDDWFSNPSSLYRTRWIVAADSDRIGVRLSPQSGAPVLERAITRELPPEGMPLGAVQVPPGGEPVIFLVDHPVTGGYPVIATVLSADIDLVAQARPGQELSFLPGNGP